VMSAWLSTVRAMNLTPSPSHRTALKGCLLLVKGFLLDSA
jgi:hypothetical protein